MSWLRLGEVIAMTWTDRWNGLLEWSGGASEGAPRGGLEFTRFLSVEMRRACMDKG